MRRLAALLVGLVLCGPAFAADVDLSWVNATKNTDNTNIPATGAGSLVRTTLEYGSCTSRNPDVFGSKVGEISVTPPATTARVNLVVVQAFCFRAFHSNTFATVFQANQAGNSDFSNVASKDIPPPKPLPPGNLVATGNLLAYTIVQSRDRVALVAVGRVAPGTTCDSAQQIMGRYVVPRASVTFVGGVQPEVVVAECGNG